MQAIRDLATMANKLNNTTGVEIPGNLTVTGTISGIGTVPIGSIIMWSGTIATIPSNYRLCDGGNGTPDLRDKFVIGATQDMYNANSGNAWKAQTNITGTQTMTGGTKDAIVVSHNHDVQILVIIIVFMVHITMEVLLLNYILLTRQVDQQLMFQLKKLV
jgi:hypothetical protein